MKHPPTPEQTTIIDHVSKPSTTPELTLVDAVAGSGKTTLLIAISEAIPHKNGLYLAYNKAIAVESQRKFPKSTHCMTTHSMAFQATVVPRKLTLGTFTYRDITERLTYEVRCSIVDNLRSFCLSKYLTFNAYALDSELKTSYIAIANKYLKLMSSGKIECTHDFYLKMFHLLLANGELTYDPFDFIMLDEAGDLNEVTLEIFKLLPSQRKIAVGDKHQNIYQFNHTINCFKVLHDQGTTLNMTKSFRVDVPIANKIQHFCRTYLSDGMDFKGTKIADKTIVTRGYLTRSNGALIRKMIELNQDSVPFSLTRKASEIFKIPLMLCSLKHKGFITNPSYKFLQNDVDNWFEIPALREKYKTVFGYLSSEYTEDFQLLQAIRLLQQHKKSVILATYDEARKHEKARHNYTLATVHSCKGAEYDEVTIADDLNESIAETVDSLTVSLSRRASQLTPKEVESLNLYYVACTRASKALYNANHL